MDFSNLTEENINQAIQFIEKNKVPPGYKSKTADLVVDGKPYPPKYVLVVAQKIADGSVIDVKDFHTRDAVDFLQERGYNIVKREKEPEMSDEEKFKCLLEYFVAHLEFKILSVIKNIYNHYKVILLKQEMERKIGACNNKLKNGIPIQMGEELPLQ